MLHSWWFGLLLDAAAREPRNQTAANSRLFPLSPFAARALTHHHSSRIKLLTNIPVALIYPEAEAFPFVSLA